MVPQRVQLLVGEDIVQVHLPPPPQNRPTHTHIPIFHIRLKLNIYHHDAGVVWGHSFSCINTGWSHVLSESFNILSTIIESYMNRCFKPEPLSSMPTWSYQHVVITLGFMLLTASQLPLPLQPNVQIISPSHAVL